METLNLNKNIDYMLFDSHLLTCSRSFVMIVLFRVCFETNVHITRVVLVWLRHSQFFQNSVLSMCYYFILFV